MRYTEVMQNLEEQEIRNGFVLLVVSLLAVAAPILLIMLKPVIVQYEIVEELVKLLIVVWMVREIGASTKWWMPMMVGGLFGMSEVILYAMNAMMVGSYEGLLLRSVVTVPMHALTTLIIFTIGRKNRGLWVVGYVVAVVVHVMFNIGVSAYQ